MPTIKEIAKASNVSVATVSNVINGKGRVSEETKRSVRKIIEELNYTPNYVAKNLKMKRTRSIGVIAEDMTVFDMPDIIDGITERCEKEDYQILLVNLRLYKKYEDQYYHDNRHREEVHRAIDKLCAKQVEGIIYVSAHERLIDVIPEDMPLPVVVAYGFTNKVEIPSVVVNDLQGAEELVNFLIDCGHKKIGVIAGKKESVHTQSRMEGYQRALFAGSILYDPDLVLYGEWERESGYKHTDILLNAGCTAIFCMNDFIAGGAYDRLNERGIQIGGEIAVVGFDNREMASYGKPPLTTMELPLHDIGYKASELILEALQKKEQERAESTHYMDCRLIIRGSVNKVAEAE